MSFRWRALAALGFLAIIAGSSTAYSATIYSDDFSGSSATALNGAAPDVRPGSETWSAATTNGWFADGSKPTATTSNAHYGALLPFVPATGQIYTLSVTLDPSSVSSGNTEDWFAFGFRPSTQTATANWATTTADPWMFLRVNRNSSTAFAFGGGSPPDATPAPTGPVDLAIVLNTQGVQWTANYLVEGVSVSSVTYATNPTITQVGFSAQAQALGTVDNFSVTVIPEPKSILLAVCSAIGLGLIQVRRRRQAA